MRNLVGGHRWAAALGLSALVITTSVVVAPGPNPGAQERDPGDEEVAGPEDALVSVDVEVADGDAAAITGALDELQANVGAQLQQLNLAEAAVKEAFDKLGTIDQAIIELEARIDELTGASDSVVVTRYMNPPSEAAIDSLTAESLSDATVKQALLQMRTEEDAAKLAELQDARAEVVEQKELQETARAEAEAARDAAEEALADLQAASGQQAQFILDVKEWLADPEGARLLAAQSPEEDARIQSMTQELSTKIAQLEQEEATREAAERAAEERRRILEGGFGCPIDGPMRFNDTWGAARSGGRSHKGTDMMSPTGTPVVAPADGQLVHKTDSIGGLSFFIYGDDGHKYFGTHLSKYENVGAGWVKAGTLVGRVGATGNASAPHL
ncbi:MAG TPA: peptidoglycan DD-metalloendopeptidase family protein, partial [Acidimicrobiales bacterium]